MTASPSAPAAMPDHIPDTGNMVPAAMPSEEIEQTALLILQVLEAASARIYPDEESIQRLEPHVERIKARYGEIRGRSFSEAHQVSRVEFIRDAIAAIFAPILAEKEREIATFDSREAEWNEVIANSLQNEEDAHRKLEDAEAALAAERERCAKIAEGPEYWPHPPEPGDRLTYRGTADHNWLAVKPPYRISSYSQGRADAAAAIRAQGE